MRRTLADVAALRVDTSAVLTGLRILALVDVRTISAGFIQLESLVADATEHAVNVLAFAENAQVAEHLTLVKRQIPPKIPEETYRRRTVRCAHPDA